MGGRKGRNQVKACFAMSNDVLVSRAVCKNSLSAFTTFIWYFFKYMLFCKLIRFFPNLLFFAYSHLWAFLSFC